MYRYLVVPGSTWYKYRTRKLETLTSGTLMSVSLGTWYQVHRVDRLLKEKGIPGMIHASPNIARIRLDLSEISKKTQKLQCLPTFWHKILMTAEKIVVPDQGEIWCIIDRVLKTHGDDCTARFVNQYYHKNGSYTSDY